MAAMELRASDTREQWLNRFVAGARGTFSAIGAPIPVNTRVSVGFSSKGIRSKVIGQCWSSTCSGDGTFEIFIVPKLDNPHDVCAVLTHELIHAAVGLDAKHGPIFKSMAVSLGLGGKMTATVPTPQWHAWADRIIDAIGPYPHAALTGSHDGRPKQKTALLKTVCDECGWLARVTLKHIEPHGYLNCPVPDCGGILQVED